MITSLTWLVIKKSKLVASFWEISQLGSAFCILQWTCTGPAEVCDYGWLIHSGCSKSVVLYLALSWFLASVISALWVLHVF